MALLDATVLQDAIQRLGPNNTFLDFEKRRAQFSAFQMFKDGSDILLPKSQLERLKKSAAQVTKIPVLNRYTATLHNTYTCNFSPDGSTSAFVPVTYSTIGFDVKIVPAVNAGNYISEADDLANQMAQGWRTAYESLEGTAVAYLESNKSNVNLSPLFGGPTAGVVTLTAAQQAAFATNLYASIPAIFQRNNLTYGKPQDLANTEALIQQQYITNQGTANGQNLQYQTAGINYYRSNYVTNANGMQETHYLTPMGAVGVYNWLPYESQITPQSEWEGWDTMVDPIMNQEWLVRYKYTCENGQWTKNWSFTASFGFMRQYSSVAGTTPILKYQVANPV